MGAFTAEAYYTSRRRERCWELTTSAAASAARESKRHLFVVDSLDKQMQNEKGVIRLASAGVGLGGLFCICVESINLT